MLNESLDGVGERERSDLGLCPRDWSTRYCTNRRERPSLLDLLSEFGLISDGWLGSISPLEIGPMHLSVKVSVLETGHTRYCRTSGSDPLRQSYRLCHGYCRKTPTTARRSGTIVRPIIF